jgi:hypothetical protein
MPAPDDPPDTRADLHKRMTEAMLEKDAAEAERDTLKASIVAQDDRLKQHVVCPISCEVMKNPVINQCGQTYEYSEINTWNHTHTTDPTTGVDMGKQCKKLYVNWMARKLIEDLFPGSKCDPVGADGKPVLCHRPS